MKHPFVKAVGAAILLCALLFGYYQMIVSHINARNVEILARMGGDRLDSIIDAMNNFESDQENMMSAASERLLASARLEAAMLRRSAAYAELANRADSMVVRVIGGRVITPADREERLDYDENIFSDDAKLSIGIVKASPDADEFYAVVCACPVQDNEYFVCWTDESAIVQLFTARNDAQTKLLSSVETAHDGYFLEIQEWDDDLAFGYKSPDLAEYETPEKMGITRQVLRDRPDTLEIGGNSYHCNYRSIEEGKRTGVFLTPLTVATFQTENQAYKARNIEAVMIGPHTGFGGGLAPGDAALCGGQDTDQADAKPLQAVENAVDGPGAGRHWRAGRVCDGMHGPFHQRPVPALRGGLCFADDA